ncbi:AMP-binding protein [Cochlodiniinecator piscidefendens]|uniref:AMP-binding protein n=1 Tax=Cochlodiniinecator piscidefendens TaxID=2715756 RepID=UPI00140A7415|nr:AMP-binding protein [Cochlodiniinecator piscidefendens]
MERRLITPSQDWSEIINSFRWNVPEHFNMADVCCSSWAQKSPEKPALIHIFEDGSEQRWSYGQLEEGANRLAHAFRARGVGAGDRVAIYLAQGPEVLLAHFAAYKLGAIALPLFTLFGEEALRYRLFDSGAKIALTDGANLPKLLDIWPELPELAHVLCTDPAKAPVCVLTEEMAKASAKPIQVQTRADDPAVLIYTSGTTGSPKGALHAHRFLLGHLPAVEVHHGFLPQPDDCGWTPADWAWIGGLMDLAMPCLYYGVPLVSHRMRKFDSDAAFELIARQRVKNLFLPPTALKMMQHASVPNDVKIRSISSGGESLSSELLAWGSDVLGAEINEIYGQTECNLVVSGSASAGVRKPGTMGRAVPGHDVAIFGADGQIVPDGEAGEIAVRAPDPVMFLRYWNKPEETAKKFRGDWLLTGDLGVRDADGYFKFLSRDDDVITSAGYRIGPGEIEHCLTGHPDVLQAAAVGVPDKLRTEIVKAFVVLREGAEWEGLETVLINRVKAKVSPHVAPKSIVVMKALPTTATGKVMRRSLRDC